MRISKVIVGFIQTPSGIAKIVGDINGVSEMSPIDDGEVSTTIPIELQPFVTQLQECFGGKRTSFDFKMKPSDNHIS